MITALARRDIEVRETQLERWRQAGLLQETVRHGLGRGLGSVSEYPPEAVDQAAELAGLVKRGRPMETVALMMFGRGRWVREDALRDAYRRELDDLIREIDKRMVVDDPLATAELIVDELERRFTQRDTRTRRWRRQLQDMWRASVDETAMREARQNGRSRPTKDELARARGRYESPENTFRSALIAAVHILQTGEPHADDALAEFLDATGITTAAQEQSGLDRHDTPAPILELLAQTLGIVSLPSLRELIDDCDIAELTQGRDEALALTESHSEIFGRGSDRTVAYGALALAAVRRSFSPADNRTLDIALYALEHNSPPRPLARPGGSAHGEETSACRPKLPRTPRAPSSQPTAMDSRSGLRTGT